MVFIPGIPPGKPPAKLARQIFIAFRRLALFIALFVTTPATVLATETSQASEPISGQILTEKMAIDKAVSTNPNLAQMQARYEALKEIPSQQGTLPDPVLSLNAMNLPSNTFHVGQEPMTQMQIGVSQAFPFPGKLALKEAASEFDAQAAGYSVDETRLRLINNVKRSWWQLFYLDRALDTVESNQALLRNFIQVAQTKYEVGDGLQQDVLLAQLELSKLLDRKIQLKAIRQSQVIQLNVLMDSPANTRIILPKTVSENMATIADQEILYRRAEAVRPLLEKTRKHISAAQSRLDLAEKNYYPDFKVGVAYGDRRGDNPMAQGGSRSDLLSLMFSVNLPIHTDRKQSRAVQQRSFELAQNRYALQDKQGTVRADISLAATNYQRAQEQFALFKQGIIPLARQTVSSMLAGYQVNQVDFLNLIRSQVTLFNYQLQYWQALTEANQALAQLAAAVGEENIYE
ncbi:MAG: TolC family protein [Porticoccaceae bacterium]|nr:TolC family protein [Porticoccaceae bacterium]